MASPSGATRIELRRGVVMDSQRVVRAGPPSVGAVPTQCRSHLEVSLERLPAPLKKGRKFQNKAGVPRTVTGMKRSTILTEEQRKALISPARIQVLEYLLCREPQTVAQLGEALGRAPDSLYYHLKKLVQVGLLRDARASGRGTRGEATYEATARAFHSKCDTADPDSVETERAGLGALLRLTERNYCRALEDPGVSTSGKRRDVLALRTCVNLDAKGRAELNRRVDELFEFLREQSTSQKGRATSVTLVLCPTEKK